MLWLDVLEHEVDFGLLKFSVPSKINRWFSCQLKNSIIDWYIIYHEDFFKEINGEFTICVYIRQRESCLNSRIFNRHWHIERIMSPSDGNISWGTELARARKALSDRDNHRYRVVLVDLEKDIVATLLLFAR